jgi:uncharacterized protein (TIGR03084 family)
MASPFADLCGDTASESAELFRVLEALDERDWQRPTACEPWRVADQISHLAWNDDATVRALTDPEGFRATRPTTPEGIQAMVDAVVSDHGDMSGAALLEWFHSARAALLDAFAAADPKARMPWYGPDMSVMSKLTARFMETWAHGWDVVSALGLEYVPQDRLRHVVFLGLQALPNAFTAHGRSVPFDKVRLELTLPGGTALAIGASDAANVVEGPAYDLALVVTQRRHAADTRLRASGLTAVEWLEVAQAFAGPPGSKRLPRTNTQSSMRTVR